MPVPTTRVIDERDGSEGPLSTMPLPLFRAARRGRPRWHHAVPELRGVDSRQDEGRRRGAEGRSVGSGSEPRGNCHSGDSRAAGGRRGDYREPAAGGSAGERPDRVEVAPERQRHEMRHLGVLALEDVHRQVAGHAAVVRDRAVVEELPVGCRLRRRNAAMPDARDHRWILSRNAEVLATLCAASWRGSTRMITDHRG